MRVLTVPDLDELRGLRARGEFFWLELAGPASRTLADVAAVLGLHDLALEDTQEFGQRPKLDTYPHEMLLVYFGARMNGDDNPEPAEVHVHISDGFVLTVNREDSQEFESVRDSVKARPPETGQAVIYRVLDALTDSILEVMEAVSDRVGDYEQQVVQRPRASDRDEMAVLRRSLGSLRRMLIIQRQVFDRAAERLVALSGDKNEAAAYYRDIGDHLWGAVDDVDMARESLQGMVDTYSNEVQERLTIVATIFLPLTVLTGFFGMNFNWLISHLVPTWAFWGLGIGGLVISAAAIAVWLRRSGMYGGGRSRHPLR
ncbi:MAG TPA: magnesium transporter CorA family protein [Streptosporangiaceae bacterium]